MLSRLDEMAQRLDAIERALPQLDADPKDSDLTGRGATSPAADSP